MSKRKQEVTLNSASNKSLTLPLTVAEKHDRERAGEIDTVRRYSNPNEHIVRELGRAKTNFKPVQLTTLSKVVDRAFTGWTIKTEK